MAVVSIIGFVIGSGGMIAYIFDPLAIMIVVTLPFLFQCIFYGKSFVHAFTIIGKKEAWIIAIVFLLIQFIIMLIWLENKEGLGPLIKFMANLIIVAGLIDLVIVLPYKILIKKHLTQIA